MSQPLATTTCAVIRGETTDALGDDIPSGIVVVGLEKLPFSIKEKSRKVYVPESDELRTVRYVVGRATPTAKALQIIATDRIRDNSTLKIYVVDEITGGERGISGTRPLVFDLRHLGA